MKFFVIFLSIFGLVNSRALIEELIDIFLTDFDTPGSEFGSQYPGQFSNNQNFGFSNYPGQNLNYQSFPSQSLNYQSFPSQNYQGFSHHRPSYSNFQGKFLQN